MEFGRSSHPNMENNNPRSIKSSGGKFNSSLIKPGFTSRESTTKVTSKSSSVKRPGAPASRIPLSNINNNAPRLTRTASKPMQQEEDEFLECVSSPQKASLVNQNDISVANVSFSNDILSLHELSSIPLHQTSTHHLASPLASKTTSLSFSSPRSPLLRPVASGVSPAFSSPEPTKAFNNPATPSVANTTKRMISVTEDADRLLTRAREFKEKNRGLVEHDCLSCQMLESTSAEMRDLLTDTRENCIHYEQRYYSLHAEGSKLFEAYEAKCSALRQSEKSNNCLQNELLQSQQQCIQLKSTVDQLENEHRDLFRRYTEATLDAKDKTDDIQKLRTELQESFNNTSSNKQIQALEEEIRMLSESLFTEEAKNKKLDTEIQALKASFKQQLPVTQSDKRQTIAPASRKSVSTKLERTTSLSGRRASTVSTSSDMDFEFELDNLVTRNEMLQELNETLQKEAEEHMEHMNSIRKELEDLNCEVSKRDEAITNLEMTILSKEREIADLDVAVEKAKSESREIMMQNKLEVKSLHAEIADLRQDAIEVIDEKKALNDRIDALIQHNYDAENIMFELKRTTDEALEHSVEAESAMEHAELRLQLVTAFEQKYKSELADATMLLTKTQQALQTSEAKVRQLELELSETCKKYGVNIQQLEEYHRLNDYKTRYTALVYENAELRLNLEQALLVVEESERIQNNVNALVSQVERKHQALELEKASVYETVAKAAQCQEQFDYLVTQLEDARSDISDHDNRVAALNDKYMREVDQFMKDKANEMKNAQSQHQTERQRLLDQIKSLESELDEISTFASEEKSCQSEVIAELNKNIASLEEELSSTMSRAENSGSEVIVWRTRAEEMSHELAQKEVALSEMETLLQDTKIHFEETNTQLMHTTEELQTTLVQLEETNTQLNNVIIQLEEQTERGDLAEQSLQTTQEELIATESMKEESIGLCNELRRQVRELKSEMDLLRLNKQNNDADAEFDRREVLMQQSRLARVEEELSSLRDENSEYIHNQHVLEEEKARLEDIIQGLKKQVAVARMTGNNNNEGSSMTVLKEELESLTVQRDRYRAQAAKLEARVDLLESESTQNDRVIQDINELNTTLNSLRHECETLRSELAMTQRKHSDALEQIEDLSEQYKNATENANKWKELSNTKIKDNDKLIRQLTNELEDARAQLRCIDEDEEASTRVLSALDNLKTVEKKQLVQLEKLQIKLEEQSVRLSQQQKQIETQQIEQEKMLSLIDSQKKKLELNEVMLSGSNSSETVTLIKSQEAKITQLQAQIEKLKNYVIEYKEKGDSRILAISEEFNGEKDLRKSLAHKLGKIKMVILKHQDYLIQNKELSALVKALSA